MKYTDIFVPGGFPIYTYNPRESKQLGEKIEEGKYNLCKLITITGQTKSGKTVLTKKIYPKKESVWVDGGSINTEEDFWNSIAEQLGVAQTETVLDSHEDIGGNTSEEVVKGTLGILGGEKKYGITTNNKRASSASRSRTVSNKILCLTELDEIKRPLIIDDFHYISRGIQATIIRALKSLIFDGVPVIIIAIPHKRYDAVKVEKEMTGRISIIQIPTWSLEELSFIAGTGFRLLDFPISNSLIDKLAEEAVGSPHLMQEFCRDICRQFVDEVGKNRNFRIDDLQIEAIFRSIAENIGRPIFEKLMKGPRQRADRKPRILKSGKTVDIYGLIIAALAHLRPGLISIEYEDLRLAIKNIIQSSLPQMHEIARVLKHMSQIASTDESSAPVIDFDDQEKKLHITDPFFSFYLKWGNM